jgi:hypothetical protein
MRALCAALALLLCGPAYAGLDHVPAWQMRDGWACYEFESARKLVLLDRRLTLCDRLEEAYVELEKQAALQAGLIEAQVALIEALRQHNAFLSGQLRVCLRDKHVAQAGQPATGWIVAGTVSAVLTGVLLTLWLTR